MANFLQNIKEAFQAVTSGGSANQQPQQQPIAVTGNNGAPILSEQGYNQQIEAAKSQGVSAGDAHKALVNGQRFLIESAQSAQSAQSATSAATKPSALYGTNPTLVDIRAKEKEDERSLLEKARASLADNKVGDYIAQKRLERLQKKYSDAKFDDDFVGQFRANYASSQLGLEYAAAISDYMDNPTEDNWQYAQSFAQLVNAFNTNNVEALDDKNVQAGWISKNAAQQLPQLVGQFKKSLPLLIPMVTSGASKGATAGGAAGAAVGGIGAVPGAIIGGVAGGITSARVPMIVGSGLFSYDVTRGMAFIQLIEQGVGQKQAKDAAEDEAILSSFVEMGDTAFDLFTMIPGKGAVIKALSKAEASVAIKTLKDAAEAFAKNKAVQAGGNVGQEYAEEFVQEILSQANAQRCARGEYDSGIMGLLKEAAGIAKDYVGVAAEQGLGNALLGKTTDEGLNEAAEAGKGGAIVGGIMGAGRALIGNKIGNVYTQQAAAKLNSLTTEDLTGISDQDLSSLRNMAAATKNEDAFKAVESEMQRRKEEREGTGRYAPKADVDIEEGRDFFTRTRNEQNASPEDGGTAGPSAPPFSDQEAPRPNSSDLSRFTTEQLREIYNKAVQEGREFAVEDIRAEIERRAGADAAASGPISDAQREAMADDAAWRERKEAGRDRFTAPADDVIKRFWQDINFGSKITTNLNGSDRFKLEGLIRKLQSLRNSANVEQVGLEIVDTINQIREIAPFLFDGITFSQQQSSESNQAQAVSQPVQPEPQPAQQQKGNQAKREAASVNTRKADVFRSDTELGKIYDNQKEEPLPDYIGTWDGEKQNASEEQPSTKSAEDVKIEEPQESVASEKKPASVSSSEKGNEYLRNDYKSPIAFRGISTSFNSVDEAMSDPRVTKDHTLADVVRAKFQQNREIRQKLFATGDAQIDAGTELGNILQEVREELRAPDSVFNDVSAYENAGEMNFNEFADLVSKQAEAKENRQKDFLRRFSGEEIANENDSLPDRRRDERRSVGGDGSGRPAVRGESENAHRRDSKRNENRPQWIPEGEVAQNGDEVEGREATGDSVFEAASDSIKDRYVHNGAYIYGYGSHRIVKPAFGTPAHFVETVLAKAFGTRGRNVLVSGQIAVAGSIRTVYGVSNGRQIASSFSNSGPVAQRLYGINNYIHEVMHDRFNSLYGGYNNEGYVSDYGKYFDRKKKIYTSAKNAFTKFGAEDAGNMLISDRLTLFDRLCDFYLKAGYKSNYDHTGVTLNSARFGPKALKMAVSEEVVNDILGGNLKIYQAVDAGLISKSNVESLRQRLLTAFEQDGTLTTEQVDAIQLSHKMLAIKDFLDSNGNKITESAKIAENIANNVDVSDEMKDQIADIVRKLLGGEEVGPGEAEIGKKTDIDIFEVLRVLYNQEERRQRRISGTPDQEVDDGYGKELGEKMSGDTNVRDKLTVEELTYAVNFTLKQLMPELSSYERKQPENIANAYLGEEPIENKKQVFSKYGEDDELITTGGERTYIAPPSGKPNHSNPFDRHLERKRDLEVPSDLSPKNRLYASAVPVQNKRDNLNALTAALNELERRGLDIYGKKMSDQRSAGVEPDNYEIGESARPDADWDYAVGTDARDRMVDDLKSDDGYILRNQIMEGSKGWDQYDANLRIDLLQEAFPGEEFRVEDGRIYRSNQYLGDTDEDYSWNKNKKKDYVEDEREPRASSPYDIYEIPLNQREYARNRVLSRRLADKLKDSSERLRVSLEHMRSNTGDKLSDLGLEDRETARKLSRKIYSLINSVDNAKFELDGINNEITQALERGESPDTIKRLYRKASDMWENIELSRDLIERFGSQENALFEKAIAKAQTRLDAKLSQYKSAMDYANDDVEHGYRSAEAWERANENFGVITDSRRPTAFDDMPLPLLEEIRKTNRVSKDVLAEYLSEQRATEIMDQFGESIEDRSGRKHWVPESEHVLSADEKSGILRIMRERRNGTKPEVSSAQQKPVRNYRSEIPVGNSDAGNNVSASFDRSRVHEDILSPEKVNSLPNLGEYNQIAEKMRSRMYGEEETASSDDFTFGEEETASGTTQKSNRKQKNYVSDFNTVEAAAQSILDQKTVFDSDADEKKLFGFKPSKKQSDDIASVKKAIDGIAYGDKPVESTRELIKLYKGFREKGSEMGRLLTDEINASIDDLQHILDDDTISDTKKAFRLEAASIRALSLISARTRNVSRATTDLMKFKSALEKQKGRKSNNKIYNMLTKTKAGEKTADAWKALESYQLNPMTMFKMLDGFDKNAGGPGYYYAKHFVQDGTAKYQKVYYRAVEHLQKLATEKGFDDFATDKNKCSVKLGDNELTEQEAIDFIKQVRHLENAWTRDGRKIDTINGFALLQKDGTYKYITRKDLDSQGRVRWEDLADKMEASLSPIAKKYLSSASEVFDVLGRGVSNTKRAITGMGFWTMETGKFYPTKFVSPSDQSVWIDDGINTVEGKNDYAVIQPTSHSVDQYINRAANYIAYGSLSEMLDIMSQENANSRSLANMVGDAYGKHFARMFDNYAKDVTGKDVKAFDDPLSNLMRKGRTNLQRGALYLSVSVPIKQVASYWSAAGIISPEALKAAYRFKGLKSKNFAGDNAIQGYRKVGGIDPTISEVLNNRSVLENIKKSNKILDAISKATSIMDYRTVDNLYAATVLDVKMNNPDLDIKSAEFKKLVEAKFEDVVLNTQPIFTKLARSEYQRTNNEILRGLSMFRTQQTQNFNRLVTAIGEYRAAKANNSATELTSLTHLQDTLRGQAAAALEFGVLSIVADLLLHKQKKYEDEDTEKLAPEKLLERLAMNTAEASAGTVWFADQAVKKMIDFASKFGNKETHEFYGVSFGAVSTIKSAIDSFETFIENPTAANARYAAGYTAQIFGCPINNVYSALNSVAMYACDIAGLNKGDYDDALRMAHDMRQPDYDEKMTTREANKALRTSNPEALLAAVDKLDSFSKEGERKGREYLGKALRERGFNSELEVSPRIANYLINSGLSASKIDKAIEDYAYTGSDYYNAFYEGMRSAGLTPKRAVEMYEEIDALDKDNGSLTQDELVEYYRQHPEDEAIIRAMWEARGYKTKWSSAKRKKKKAS